MTLNYNARNIDTLFLIFSPFFGHQKILSFLIDKLYSISEGKNSLQLKYLCSKTILYFNASIMRINHIKVQNHQLSLSNIWKYKSAVSWEARLEKEVRDYRLGLECDKNNLKYHWWDCSFLLSRMHSRLISVRSSYLDVSYCLLKLNLLDRFHMRPRGSELEDCRQSGNTDHSLLL